MPLNDKLLRHVRRYQPYAAMVETAFIVVGSVLAIVQLHAGNRQAKVANTLAFLGNMQTAEFHNNYHDGIAWLERSVLGNKSQADTDYPDMDRKLAYILDRYENLWVIYDEGILDRPTIEATVGVQISQFWLLTRTVFDEERRRGYESLDLFLSALERSRSVKGSKAYNKLKEEIERCKASRKPQQ